MKRIFTSLFLITHLQVCAQQAPVTTIEANKFGSEIETAFNTGDTPFLHRLIDGKSLLKNIEPKSKALQNATFRRSLEGFAMWQFGDETIAMIKNGGYKMLKAYEKGGKQHLLFRAYGNGFNYQDFTLTKVGSLIKAEDVYAYTSGEELSTTLASTFDIGFNAAKGSDALSDDEKILVKIIEYKKQGDYITEEQLFGKLGNNLRNSKGMQMLYITACRHISMDMYKAAIENYVSLFPNEPNAYLMVMDIYTLNKQYDKGIAAIEKLDSLIGGDTYLYFYKGLLLKRAGKFADSKSNFEKCFNIEPSITINMQQLADDYCIEGDFEKAKALIANYKKTPNFKPDDLAPLYKAYPSLKDKV